MIISCRRHAVCDLSGPELFASDYCTSGAGGWVAISPARWVSNGQLQWGPSALLPHRTTYLIYKSSFAFNSLPKTHRRRFLASNSQNSWVSASEEHIIRLEILPWMRCEDRYSGECPKDRYCAGYRCCAFPFLYVLEKHWELCWWFCVSYHARTMWRTDMYFYI